MVVKEGMGLGKKAQRPHRRRCSGKSRFFDRKEKLKWWWPVVVSLLGVALLVVAVSNSRLMKRWR